jgi:ferritin-like protein
MSSEGLHESENDLSPQTRDRHRAIASLMEELEAVDWYDQRIDAAIDPDLADILRHNRDEEKEHASMVLEWLRRNDPALDRNLRRYLFSSGSIVGNEEEDGPGAGSGGAETSLGVGNLDRKEPL